MAGPAGGEVLWLSFLGYRAWGVTGVILKAKRQSAEAQMQKFNVAYSALRTQYKEVLGPPQKWVIIDRSPTKHIRSLS